MSAHEVQHPVVLFDGGCNLCSGSARFIINRDPSGIFRFAPLQSETGKKLLSKFDLPNDKLDSIILVENGEYYLKSTAVLRILQRLGSLWELFYIFIWVPTPIRDYFYDIVAKNRYKWHRNRAQSMVPSEDFKSRFLE